MFEKITGPDYVFNQEDSQKIVSALIALYPKVGTELNYYSHFQLLVAVILSAQATDTAVNQATPGLFTKFPDAKAMAQADIEDIKAEISGIGLYNKKAKYLKEVSQLLVDHYQGKVPTSRDALMRLPGVGRKTANVILSNGFNIPAFGVDSHVSRVAKRLHLVSQDTSTNQVEAEFTAKIAEQDWFPAHQAFINFGRHVCSVHSHDHKVCQLALEEKMRIL